MATSFPAVEPVRPDRFEGRFSLYDDGWPGSLVLTSAGGRDLRGNYHSYRLDGDYDAVATVDEHEPHRIEICLLDFNGLDRQVLSGYLFSRGGNAITGGTSWKDEPYGFVARRGKLWNLSPFHDESPTRPEHFEGSYSLYYDGGRGTVRLRHLDDRLLAGTWSRLGAGRQLPITAEVDAEVPYRITLRLTDPAAPAADGIVTGWQFTRPKNVVAGWLDVAGTRRGCYLVRFR